MSVGQFSVHFLCPCSLRRIEIELQMPRVCKARNIKCILWIRNKQPFVKEYKTFCAKHNNKGIYLAIQQLIETELQMPRVISVLYLDINFTAMVRNENREIKIVILLLGREDTQTYGWVTIMLQFSNIKCRIQFGLC